MSGWLALLSFCLILYDITLTCENMNLMPTEMYVCTKYKLAPLNATLNNAARHVTGSRSHDHITPSLKALNWLPYEARIQLKLLAELTKQCTIQLLLTSRTNLNYPAAHVPIEVLHHYCSSRPNTKRKKHTTDPSQERHQGFGTLSLLR